MLTKQGVAITFYAFFVDSTNLDGETGLTVTVDIFEGTTGTPIVSGGSATELAGGIYFYTLASGSVDADGAYVAVFKTTSAAVVQKHLPALWSVGTTLKAVDDVTNDVTIAADQSAVTVGTVTTVTNGVTLVNDAITAAKFDESTAYPLKAADTGSTQVARTGADADTLETLSDQIDGVEPADVWAYATRTLTQTAAQVTAAVAGATLAIVNAVTFDGTLTGLTIPATWTKIWLTIKTSDKLADSQAIVQILESNPGVGTDGLLYLNGVAAMAAQGTLVVDQAAGTVQITIDDAATALLDENSRLGYDVKVLLSGGTTQLLTIGTATVVLTETKAIA